MYIISAVLENNQSRVALYGDEYKLLFTKTGACTDLTKLCADVISEGGITAADVEYIGVAGGCCTYDPAEVEKAVGIKCYTASVLGARALGEAYIANDVPHLIFLKIDDTTETSIVINKKIYTGAGMGGNFGHMVINFGGYECTCGRKGCFGAYASNSGFARLATEAGIKDAASLSHADIFNMDTPEAETVKTDYVKYLANGITTIINLFQPNELVLEGPFSGAGDKLMGPTMEIILREQYSRGMVNKCNIRFASESDTALLGAALLGR